MPAVVMITGTFWNKKAVLIGAIIFSLFATYTLCNISVRDKWEKRFEFFGVFFNKCCGPTPGLRIITISWLGPTPFL